MQENSSMQQANQLIYENQSLNTSHISYELADNGARFLAGIIDIFCYAFLSLLGAIPFIFLVIISTPSNSDAIAPFGIFSLIFAFLIGPLLSYALIYLVVPVVKNGQTFGKMILHMKVVDENGNKPSFSKYFVRFIMNFIVLGFTSYLINIIIIANDKRQSFGDIVAKTYVVKR